MAKTLSIKVVIADAASKQAKAIGGHILGIGRSIAGIRLNPLQSLLRVLTSVKTVVAGAAAFFVGGAVIRSLNDVVDKMDEIGKISARTGLGVEQVQELALVSERAQIPLEGIAKLAGDIGSKIAEAATTGQGSAKRAIDRLKLQVYDVNGELKDSGQLLDDIVAAMQDIESAGEREFLLKQLGSEEAARLLTVINGGLDEYLELKRRARELGIFTPQEIELAVKYKDAVADLARAWDRIKGIFVTAIVPIVLPVIDKITDGMISLQKQARTLAQGLALVLGPLDKLEPVALELGVQPGELRAELYGALQEIQRATERFAFDMGLRIIEFIIRGIAASIPFAGALLLDLFKNVGLSIIEGIGIGIAEGASALGQSFRGGILQDAMEVISQIFKPSGVSDEMAAQAGRDVANNWAEQFDTYADDMRSGIDIARQRYSENGDLGAALKKLGDDARAASVKALGEVTEGTFEDAKARAQQFEEEIGPALDFFASVLERMGSLLDVPPPTRKPSGGGGGESWTDFFDGFVGGVKSAKEALGDLQTIGQAVGTQFANTFAGQATDALFAFIDGTKSAKEAFQDFAVSVIRDISRMIIQILILRALGFAFGSTGSETDAAGAAAAGVSAVSKNKGGVIQQVSRPMADVIPGFNSGAIVPGPNVNQDVVLARLTPGEGVLNRGAMRRMGEDRLAYANQGGRLLREDEAAPSVKIEQHFHLSGSATQADAERVGKQAAQGVLRALERSPHMRSQFKSQLGVRS